MFSHTVYQSQAQMLVNENSRKSLIQKNKGRVISNSTDRNDDSRVGKEIPSPNQGKFLIDLNYIGESYYDKINEKLMANYHEIMTYDQQDAMFRTFETPKSSIINHTFDK